MSKYRTEVGEGNNINPDTLTVQQFNWLTASRVIINKYNNSRHSTLEMTPTEVRRFADRKSPEFNPETFRNVCYNVGPFPRTNVEIIDPPKFKNNDIVYFRDRHKQFARRITKGTAPNFYRELYRIQRCEFDHSSNQYIYSVVKLDETSKNIKQRLITVYEADLLLFR